MIFQRELTTVRGDRVLVSLFDDPPAPTVLLSVDDADGTAVPTAEFTVPEAAELREAIRSMCEEAERERTGRWTTRR